MLQTILLTSLLFKLPHAAPRPPFLPHPDHPATTANALFFACARACLFQSTVNRLADADFPADCPAFVLLAESLADVNGLAAKWMSFSWRKKVYSVSLADARSNAFKYRVRAHRQLPAGPRSLPRSPPPSPAVAQ